MGITGTNHRKCVKSICLLNYMHWSPWVLCPVWTDFLWSDFQESLDPEIFADLPRIFAIDEHVGSYTIPCEVSPGKFLHINASLDESQQEKLLKILKNQTGAFAWEYTDMKGIHPDTCVHHMYTDEKIAPVRQPQYTNFPNPYFRANKLNMKSWIPKVTSKLKGFQKKEFGKVIEHERMKPSNINLRTWTFKLIPEMSQ